MARPGMSLKSSLRQSVIGAYRVRGRRNSNLWLVYSPKTDADWLIPSDRQLVHWLYFLEANPEVHSFNLAPDPIISHDSTESKATELDAIVTLQNGQTEWHEVKAGKNINNPAYASQMEAQASAAAIHNAKYIRFNDLDLKPKVKVAMRWVKPICFAAAIRAEDQTLCRTGLVIALKEIGAGNIQQILSCFEGYDPAVLLGVLVRLAIGGVIRLDLENSTFGLLTEWKYYGQ